MPEVRVTPRGWVSGAEVSVSVPGTKSGSGYSQVELSVWLDQYIPPPPSDAPSIPVGLAATNVTTTSFTLSWDGSVSPADWPLVGYIVSLDGVLYADVTSGIAVVEATVKGAVGSRLQLPITGLTAGTVYAVTVTAYNAAAASEDSAALPVLTLNTVVALAPNAPQNFAAPSIDTTLVNLTWTASTLPAGASAVTGYNIYSAGTTLQRSVGVVTSAQLVGLTPDTPYSLTVRAVNSAGQSNPSSVLSVRTLGALVAPAAPTNLLASAVGSGYVSLAWTASTDLVDGYRIYRGPTLAATTSTTSTTVSGLTNGTAYTFTAYAYRGALTSATSNPVTATPVAVIVPVVPTAPTGLAVASTSSQTVTLDWLDNPAADNVSSYRVYNAGTVKATVTISSASVTGLTDGTAYVFTVRAVNGVGESLASTSVTATPQADVTTGARRFRLGCWYEKPLPAAAPIHPQSAAYLTYLTTALDFTPDCRLVGAMGEGLATFAPGYYKVTANDPVYHIRDFKGNCPAMFLAGGPGIRLPTVAKQYYGAAGANDAPMMVYVTPQLSPNGRGFFVWFAMVLWHPGNVPVSATDVDRTGAWEMGGTGAQLALSTGADGAHYFTDSFGHASPPLKDNNVLWPASLLGSGRPPSYYTDEQLNGHQSSTDNSTAGFRGCNTMIRCVDYDRVMAEGRVNHVMEFFQGPSTASQGRWPMVAYESKGGTIPEGTRMRIKATIDVAAKLNTDTAYYGNPASRTATEAIAYKQAYALAKGMQDFGVMVADNAGHGSKIKLGSTVKQGRGDLWKVPNDALRKFPFATDWVVIADFYDPPDVG